MHCSTALTVLVQSPQDEKVALKEIHDTLRQCYELINSTFTFYPTGTSADVFHMGLNQFTALLEDCKVPLHSMLRLLC